MTLIPQKVNGCEVLAAYIEPSIFNDSKERGVVLVYWGGRTDKYATWFIFTNEPNSHYDGGWLAESGRYFREEHDAFNDWWNRVLRMRY